MWEEIKYFLSLAELFFLFFLFTTGSLTFKHTCRPLDARRESSVCVEARAKGHVNEQSFSFNKSQGNICSKLATPSRAMPIYRSLLEKCHYIIIHTFKNIKKWQMSYIVFLFVYCSWKNERGQCKCSGSVEPQQRQRRGE